MKIVALMALADLCGLPSLLFTLLWTSIAADFQVAVLLARYELRVAALRCAKGPFVAGSTPSTVQCSLSFHG